MARLLSAGVLLTAVVLAVGCGQSGPATADVSGKVTYKGEPIPKGEIRFIPVEGTVGPVSGARIVNGAYEAKGAGGVPVGKHKVTITALKDLPAPEGVPFTPQQNYLPDKYNTRSQLEFTVPPGSRSLTKDFELTE